jgi:hypothetical protein
MKIYQKTFRPKRSCVKLAEMKLCKIDPWRAKQSASGRACTPGSLSTRCSGTGTDVMLPKIFSKTIEKILLDALTHHAVMAVANVFAESWQKMAKAS